MPSILQKNFHHRQVWLKPNFCLVVGTCSMQFKHSEIRWKPFQLFVALGEKVWPYFVDPSSKIQSRVKSADIFLYTIILILSNSEQHVWKVLENFPAGVFGIATKWWCYIATCKGMEAKDILQTLFSSFEAISGTGYNFLFFAVPAIIHTLRLDLPRKWIRSNKTSVSWHITKILLNALATASAAWAISWVLASSWLHLKMFPRLEDYVWKRSSKPPPMTNSQERNPHPRRGTSPFSMCFLMALFSAFRFHRIAFLMDGIWYLTNTLLLARVRIRRA